MVDLTAPDAGTRRRRLGVPASWVLLVLGGLLVGALAWHPVLFAWLLGLVVAGELGWVAVDPTLVDDGIGVVVWATGVLWFVLLGVAGPLIWAMRRVSSLPARTWWPVSVALWVTPFAVALLRSELG